MIGPIACSSASDHYAIFADFGRRGAGIYGAHDRVGGRPGGTLTFDSTINQAYTIQFADNINEPAAWSNVAGLTELVQ